MKPLLPALAICLLPLAARAADPDKRRIRELEEKVAALEAELAKLREHPPGALLDPDGKISARLSNAVLIIEGDQSVGTGFVVAAGGKKYVYTAAHVFSGNTKLTIRNAAGTGFKKFGPLEAAEGADLVRLELLEDARDFLELVPPDAPLAINTPIAALGNGGGNGVVSVENGKILGTSGDTLEVDAGIIQGNSGGPVVDAATGNAVGLVTHLTSARKDLWSEGTRQGDVRRFACRLNKTWQWKSMNIGVFLTNSRELEDFDEQTRLCFAMAMLEPQDNGLRLDTKLGGSRVTALEVLQKNEKDDLVKSLVSMNSDLASRKGTLSEADLKKKFRSLLGQARARAGRSGDSFKPQGYAWFHRHRAEDSVRDRKECLEALDKRLERLK